MKILAMLLMLCARAIASPTIFFSDILSGPASGNSDTTYSATGGAYVTLYGNSFGASQGGSTISLNGSSCLTVVSWGSPWLWYQKIVVKLGTTCTTGSFVVTVGGSASNGMAFTVRSGNIKYSTAGGNDSTGNGSFSTPYRTVKKCKNSIVSGDVCYIRSMSESSGDDYGSVVILGDGNSAATPRALVVYPGDAVTVSGLSFAFKACHGLSSCPDGSYYVVAGFNADGSESAFELGTDGNRIVGNVATCHSGSGDTGCVVGGHSINTVLLGNEVTDVGTVGTPQKTYHAVYFSTDANEIEIGWSWIHNSNACRGILFHSTPPNTTPNFGLHVHDNLIHDIRCDGVDFALTTPGLGTGIELYNNVIYNAGQGPDFANGPANFTCTYIGLNGGAGTYEVYNNLFYNCGFPTLGVGGSVQIETPEDTPDRHLNLRNNIFVQTNGLQYMAAPIDLTKVQGSNNVYYGNGNGPSQTTSNTNSNPLVVDLTGHDFHPTSSSPSRDAGIFIGGLTYDRDGNLRGGTDDIGPYEFSQSSSAPSISRTGKVTRSGK